MHDIPHRDKDYLSYRSPNDNATFADAGVCASIIPNLILPAHAAWVVARQVITGTRAYQAMEEKLPLGHYRSLRVNLPIRMDALDAFPDLDEKSLCEKDMIPYISKDDMRNSVLRLNQLCNHFRALDFSKYGEPHVLWDFEADFCFVPRDETLNLRLNHDCDNADEKIGVRHWLTGNLPMNECGTRRKNLQAWEIGHQTGEPVRTLKAGENSVWFTLVGRAQNTLSL